MSNPEGWRTSLPAQYFKREVANSDFSDVLTKGAVNYLRQKGKEKLSCGFPLFVGLITFVFCHNSKHLKCLHNFPD